MLDLLSYLIPRAGLPTELAGLVGAGKATELLVAAGRLSSTVKDLTSYLTHRVTFTGEAASSARPNISLQEITLMQNNGLPTILDIDN